MEAAAGADVTDPDIVVAELAGLAVPAVADVPLGDAPDVLAGLAVGCAVCCTLASGCTADPVKAAVVVGADVPLFAPPAAAAAIVATAWLVLDPVPDWLAGLIDPVGALVDAVPAWLIPAVADDPLGDAPDALAGLAMGCAVC